MSAAWQQALAAIVAALVPIVVKMLNDWHAKMMEDKDQDKEVSGGQ